MIEMLCLLFCFEFKSINGWQQQKQAAREAAAVQILFGNMNMQILARSLYFA